MTQRVLESKDHARRGVAVLALLLGSLAPGVGAADDAALFSAKVPPNVMLIVDDSTSMFSSIFHPAYDPTVNYRGSCWDFSGSPWNMSAGPAGVPATHVSGVSVTHCGKTRVIPGLDTDADGVDDAAMGYYANYLYWLFSDAVMNTWDIDGDGSPDGTIYDQIQNYQRPFSGCRRSGSYKVFHQDRATAARYVMEDVLCKVNKSGKIRFGFATFRHTSSPGPNGGFVQVPINDPTWDHDSNPATTEVDYSYALNGSTKTQLEHLYDAFFNFSVDSNTPLAETLFQIYTYFMNRDPAKTPYGDSNKDGVVDSTAGRFPQYQYVTDPFTDYGGRNISSAAGLTAPPCPVNEWCQKNFVILLTDGEPTDDDFYVNTSGASGNTGVGFSRFGTLIGSYLNGGKWLDDVAKFMQDQDFLPDTENPGFPGKQNIDTYTVGFATDVALNDFLRDVASVGGGTFASSGDPQVLTDHIVAAIQSIIEKSQVFTAPTVPASRSSDGNNFYLSYFKPADRNAFWEGHLKLFEINAAGEIKDANGGCIFRDPNNLTTVRCDGGVLQLDLPAFWDAADEIPAPGARNLYVSDYQSGPPASTPATPSAFTEGTMDAVDLGVTIAEAPFYAGVDAGPAGMTTDEHLADALVRYARGCEFGSGACIARSKTLGDIFHSSPLAVGPPNGAHANLGYQEFAKRYATRTRVIYAGVNDGFLHAFHTGEWQSSPTPAGYDRGTGAEMFGFMPYPARKNIKQLPIDLAPRDYYYVDGAPSVADVWLPPSDTAVPGGASDWVNWHSVLIGGMRQGGETVYALDVTDPPDSSRPGGVDASLPFPAYLWEFPCEDQSKTACTGSGAYTYAQYMGESWSKPVITKIKMAPSCSPPGCPAFVERWVAIFGAGYDESGDPNEPTGAAYDATLGSTTSRKGRAVFMIDVASGQVLAMKRFDHSVSDGDPVMRYAFVSEPAVFDVDFDGFADVVYIGDLGGQLWKWVIHDQAQDTVTASATGDVLQSQWPWKRLFLAEPCDATTCGALHTKSIFYPPTGTVLHGQLYLAFGTGERADLEYIGTQPEEKNRFYVVKDIDPLESNPPSPDSEPRYSDGAGGAVKDVSNYSGSCTPPTGGDVGFYFEGALGEKFITESTIFAGGVLTGSFMPSGSTGGCDAAGDGYLYYFDLFCGQGRWDDPNSSNPADVVPKKWVGKGPPTPPTVSMGSLSSQSGGTGCNNKVFGFASAGEGIVGEADCVPTSGIRTRSWKDLN